jgi:hypothetical protein
MYFAGIMDHLSGAPKMELIVWGSTAGFCVNSLSQLYRQVARSKAGKTKPGSTGPRVLTTLSITGQLSGIMLPLLVYWTTTAYNKFHRPEWLAKYDLPSPPDVFGVDGVVVGRGVGLLVLFTGMILADTAVKALGEQFLGIGVSLPPPLVLPETSLRPPRVIDQGKTETR